MAKILEAAWSRAAVTRNALPFFLPLKLASTCVPVPDSKTRVSAMTASTVGTTGAAAPIDDTCAGYSTGTESDNDSPQSEISKKSSGSDVNGEGSTAVRSSRKRTREVQAALSGQDEVEPVSLLKDTHEDPLATIYQRMNSCLT